MAPGPSVGGEAAVGFGPRVSDDAAPRGPRIEADLDLCQGHRMCQDEAPGVLGWDEDRRQVVVLDAQPGADRGADMQAAARSCPAMALTVTEREETR